jgi:acetylornithine deacetylase/succinyl-diaminopimelate desuccinylase-like protein
MVAYMLKEVTEEVTNFLSGLIKINTTNPPGNEIKAAKYVAEDLKKDGFKCDLFESAPGRGSVVTRLKGTGEKPSLLLLSHLDVVAANPKEWSVDPFSGLVEGGFVWGRGALDMKGMTAVEVMALKLLKRNKMKLKGDLILAATADEEKGGEAGAGWLVQNHLDKVKADYVLNEGGGTVVPMNGKGIYTIQTAEKGILWFKVKVKGTPGHGSVPGMADNAIMRMNKIIDRLGNYRAGMVLVPTVRQFLTEAAKADKYYEQAINVFLQNPSMGDQLLDMLAQADKEKAEQLRAMLRMTITPTMINAGTKENIIPSECETVFDCRVLPGQTPNQALATIKDLLKDVGMDKLEFEIIQANEPSESSLDTPLYRLIENVVRESDPKCLIAPFLLTGGTDSRFFRHLGATCYGFHPVNLGDRYNELIKTIHGIDERISIDNLVLGTSLLYEVIKRFVT